MEPCLVPFFRREAASSTEVMMIDSLLPTLLFGEAVRVPPGEFTSGLGVAADFAVLPSASTSAQCPPAVWAEDSLESPERGEGEEDLSALLRGEPKILTILSVNDAIRQGKNGCRGQGRRVALREHTTWSCREQRVTRPRGTIPGLGMI